jgi:hypothetical protein
MRWSNPDFDGVDHQYFDVAIDAGFVNYVLQQRLQPGEDHQVVTLDPRPGTYYVRLNTHYAGLGERGWMPSSTLIVELPGALPQARGAPATNLRLRGDRLTWTPGSGAVTKTAVDVSASSDFSDILSAPFVAAVNGTLAIDTLPIACDLPPGADHLRLFPLPPGGFFIRVNTLLEGRTWLPSKTWPGGANRLLIAGVTMGIAALTFILGKRL